MHLSRNYNYTYYTTELLPHNNIKKSFNYKNKTKMEK